MLIFNKDTVREPLYVVVPYQNHWRYKSRVKHTQRALKHFHDSGATIVLVEIGFNRREFEFDGCGLDGTLTNCEILSDGAQRRHRHIQLRTTSELWLKENAINIGVASLPHDWEQVAWLDSDVHFLRPNWVGETIQKLQHYDFVQMFSHARDLGPNYEMLDQDYPHANGSGFMHAWIRGYLQGLKDGMDICCGPEYGTVIVGKIEKRVWPGLAWACTRRAWEAVGGLLDIAVWGGCDHHMAWALVGGESDTMMRGDLHRNYKKMVMQLWHRCQTEIRQNVGVVEGSITHHWHGKKTNRNYNQKHQLLAKAGFDPPRHLKRDNNGLWILCDDQSKEYIMMRDMMRAIARLRNEDANEI